MLPKQIMIVEDMVILSTDLRMKLKKLGYEVSDVITYGEQVAEAVHKKTPDLILMDVMLKGQMDGIEAAKHVKKEFDIPIIFLTACSDETTLARVKEIAPHGFLKKPIVPDDLRITLDIALFKADMESRLRESELRYKTVADFAYDWETWVGPEGDYKYMSPSCERVSGYHRDEFMENPRLFIHLVHPEDRKAVKAHLKKGCGPEEDDACRVDFRIRRRDGEERWIEHYCRGVYDSEGKFLGRRASNRDVTARKKAEEDRESLIKELQAAITEIKKLSGLLPICSSCKKIRDDTGYWNQIESYIRKHSEADFTHSICPECAKKLYPDFSDAIEKADSEIKKNIKKTE